MIEEIQDYWPFGMDAALVAAVVATLAVVLFNRIRDIEPSWISVRAN